MSKQSSIDKCEVSLCTRKAVYFNETVRQKGTENVKIMNICKLCYEKITGAR